MAQRTVALCNGEYIGIESIFTVINGKQINIPDKVKTLREKSHQNLLFCPCGCGANLTLVAGDRNLREQHFRLKDGEYESNCHLVTEGKVSVDSKIVLKCWLDDKLKDPFIQARVPISAIDDVNRKYEFTLFSKSKSVAISYTHNRVNLSDEKFDILENNSKNIKIIYIVDHFNGGVCGQYPESLMKIQSKQGYCLYLTVDDIDYYKAKLTAVFYAQDLDGLWTEKVFAEARISEYDIVDGRLVLEDKSVELLLEESKTRFIEEQETIKARRAQQEAIKARRAQQEVELAEKQRLEIEHQKLEEDRKRAELAEIQRIEKEKRELEELKREEVFKAAFKDGFENQEEIVRDASGVRWVKCEFCGKKAKESEFASYGGEGRVNLGTCSDCQNNNPIIIECLNKRAEVIKRQYDPNICPECGAQLKERSGPYGLFMGCSTYPACTYKRKIKH